MTASSFDRVRRRNLEERDSLIENGEVRVPDREGKRALFSAAPEPPTFGSVAITCTKCEGRTVVSWSGALKLAFPSIPAIAPGSGVRMWLKCPACKQRSWVSRSLTH